MALHGMGQACGISNLYEWQQPAGDNEKGNNCVMVLLTFTKELRRAGIQSTGQEGDI